MPRATRKALAEETPSRSSPRASTRASTVAAASPSPAKSRGRHGKAEEPETSAAVETKTRGRPSSRAKAAAVTPPTPPTGRQSRSRSGSAAKGKATPTPPKRGRGKPKKEPEEEEEEEEEEDEEEEEEDAEEEEKVPTKRGRAPKKTKPPPAAKKSTPPARASRAPRRSAEKAAKEEEEEEEGPKKTTPRRGREKSAPAAATQSRSRRGRGAGEPQEEEEPEETAEEGKTDESGEAKKEEADSEMKEKPSATDSKQKAEEEQSKAEESEKVEASSEEISKDQGSGVAKQKEGTTVKKAEPVVPTEKKETEATAEKKTAAEDKIKGKADAPSEEKQESATKSKAVEGEKATPKTEDKVDAQVPAAEKMEAQSTEEAAPAEEPMEEEDSTPAIPQPPADTKNGDMDGEQLPRKPAVKRKLEEEDVEESVDESQAKRARVNGTAGEAAAEVEMKEPAAAEDESKLLKDYEVVNKEELPAPDSAEVAAAVPAPVAESKPAQAEGEKMEESGSGKLVTVIPLTEAEVAKAYASEVQAIERGETDDVSSTIVEVGSVTGSDVTGGLSRGLDVSELQSASNSVDGDDMADSSMNESSAAPEANADFVAPVVPVQETCDQSKAAVPDSSSVAASDSTVPDVTQKDVSALRNGAGASSAVDQQPASQNDSSAQQTASSVPDGAPLQNSHPNPPLAKGSGSVTDVLGTPDPAFLAAYSSPGILNRAYVPNPAVPADSVASQDMFSVVSYNILAECHRRKSEYKNTPDEFLGQEYRHNLLIKELQYLNGDIVCLQEVDPDYFSDILLPAMQGLGYDGLIKRRTKEYYHEGEATFYKCNVFELESSRGVSLTEVAHKEVETSGLSSEVATAINKYLDRADVVLITRLRCKATGKVITVGNIHVVWDLKSPDVQCIQAACAIKEVVGMSGSEGAHIVCGDFNAEWSSPVYQLVLDGYLSDSSIHALQSIQRLELSEGTKSLVNHWWRAFQHTSSNMKSAYSTVAKSEAEVTSYSSNMKTVDYVFYSASSLAPVGVLKTINAPVIKTTTGLPTKDFPSDHLALKSVMAFCK